MGASLDRPLSTKTWALWLAATVATFAALEAHAVSSRRIPTLSHCLRVWLRLAPAKRGGPMLAVAFCGFFLWMCGHIALAWPPNLKQPGGTP